MRIALYQPDIPQNTGNIFRLGACMGVAVDIIEPTGFVFDDKKFKRSAMDYIDHLEYKRHNDWQHFYKYDYPPLLIVSISFLLSTFRLCSRRLDSKVSGKHNEKYIKATSGKTMNGSAPSICELPIFFPQRIKSLKSII